MGIKKTTRGQHVATRGWLSPHGSAVDDSCYACYVVGSVIHVPISIKVHSQPLKRFQHPLQEMEALVTAKSILSFLEMNKSQETLRRFVNQNPAPFLPTMNDGWRDWVKGMEGDISYGLSWDAIPRWHEGGAPCCLSAGVPLQNNLPAKSARRCADFLLECFWRF